MVSALRVDDAAGIVEEAEFFGDGPDRLFGIRYLPASGKPVAGVVMCTPILAQFRAHYRSGVLSARALAARGVAVQRFHYRGMGNSDGDQSALSLSTMTEDAMAAAARLTEQAGPLPVAYLGVNVGGYPAASASRAGNPLILDSPPSSGRTYFRNALRAHAVYKLRREGDQNVTTDTLLEELRKPDADVSLLGCRVYLALYESLYTTSLVETVGPTPRPTMLIGLGEGGVLKPEGEKVRSELTERGFEVRAEVRDKVDPFWYVENAAPEDQTETGDTADKVTRWLIEIGQETVGTRSLEDA